MSDNTPFPKPLLLALQSIYPDSTKATLRQWIKYGRVSVNGRKQKFAKTLVEESDEVRLLPPPLPKIEGLSILYQDQDVIAIYKPPGLLSVPQDIPGKDSALRLLRKQFSSAHVHTVHRLDREASGVLLFAKSPKVQHELKNTFASHDLVRQYHALVWGHPDREKGTWDCYLKELPNSDVVIADKHDGKRAVTHYKVLKKSAKFSLLQLTLETGKKHQIRVHCQNANLPIVGDPRYGEEAFSPFKRMCLHASYLEIQHPCQDKLLKLFYRAPKWL